MLIQTPPQCVRSVLHSNATFSLLAEKLDIMAVSDSVLQGLTGRTFGEGDNAPRKSRPEVKKTADLFETIIGAYHNERGFDALCVWVEELYTPLLKAVAETFYNKYVRVFSPSRSLSSMPHPRVVSTFNTSGKTRLVGRSVSRDRSTSLGVD